MNSSRRASPKIFHQGSGKATVASVGAGNAVGNDNSGFCESTRETKQPLKATAIAATQAHCALFFMLWLCMMNLRGAIRGRLRAPGSESGNPAIEQRHEQRRDERGAEHAADHCGSQCMTAR